MFPQPHLLTIGFGELLRNGLAFGARVLEPLLRKEPLARRRRIERHLLQQLGEFLKETKPHRFIVVAILSDGLRQSALCCADHLLSIVRSAAALCLIRCIEFATIQVEAVSSTATLQHYSESAQSAR
jgi:hypothetical protein